MFKFMSKIWLFFIIILFAVPNVQADKIGTLLEEADGTPAGYIYKLKMPNGSLTISGGVGTYVAVGGGGGDLLADGSVPLSANWDLGAFTLTATQFISDIAIGTAPFVVTSTTEVANLLAATATLATTVTVTDNEATNENNPVWFSAGAAGSGSVGAEADGDFTYNPSTGTVGATLFSGSGASLTALSGANITADSLLEPALNTTNAAGAGTDNYLLSYNHAGTNYTWVIAGSGAGDLLADGTVELTANWDAGPFTFTGTQFISDIAIGTAPFVVTSTTNVPNLNASSLGGATFAAPGAIGGTTPAAGTFTEVSIPQSATASYSRFYEGSGDGANYHDLHGQAFAANRASYLPDYVVGFLLSTKVDAGGDFADDSIDSQHYVAASIDNEHLADSAVDTAEIAADAVEGTKIADDQVDSEHYVAGSIDNEHMADNAVGVDELATDSVTMDAIDADGNFASLTGDWTTTGYVSGQANVQTDASGAITMTVNAVNYGTDTGDADIPDGACDAAGDVGNYVVLISSAADQYSLTSNDASNQFIIAANAAALTAGDELDVDGTMVCVMCIAAELWKVTGYMGAIPTDGGVAD